MAGRIGPALAPARRVLVTLLACCLALAWNEPFAKADEPPAETWLRGSDDNLELRLHGEILDADGQPADDVALTGILTFSDGNEPIDLALDGHRFEAWLPVNKFKTHSVRLRAATADGSQVAHETLMSFRLRQSAIEGLQLQLTPATRRIAIRAIADGQPVPHATVEAEYDHGFAIRTTADAAGVATIQLVPAHALSRLTAWSADGRIGGFRYGDGPNYDAAADEQIVELEKCRPQTIRLIDDRGQPVAGVSFSLRVTSPAPDNLYIGFSDDYRLTSDEHGEAICGSYPIAEKTRPYIEAPDKTWHIDGALKFENDALIVPLKRNAERQSIPGKLQAKGTHPGGFNVSVSTFQGEREHFSDETSRFTNADGSYELHVLPDATYCAYPFDSRWTGPTIDWIPFDSKTGKLTPPELAVDAGETLTIIATAGPEKKPLAHLGVGVSQRHDYSWRADGQTNNGSSGPHYWLWTDQTGRAEIHVTPGPVRALVFTDDWRTEQTIEVAAGQQATITLHRPVAGPRTICGQLVREQGVDGVLAGLEIVAGAVDGNFDKVDRVVADADGKFELKSAAAQLGFFVRIPDGAATAAAIVSDLDEPVTLTLRPTLQYQGQLLGKNDAPLRNHGVRAIVTIAGEENYNGLFIKSFEAARIEAKTDDEGRFTLTGIPSEMPVRLHADALDGGENGVYLEEFYLEPGETRPPSVNRLAPSAAAAVTPDPLAVRYEAVLRDCRLNGYGLMIIAAADAPNVKEFINRYLTDYQENKNAAKFMQFNVPADRGNLSDDDRRFLAEQGWSTPSANGVWAIACDARGAQLGRLELDSIVADAATRAKQFVNQHAPPADDAQEKWREAFELAKQTDRHVWARMGGRYCGPCHRLSRWIEDHQAAIEKDYVLLKIDDFQDAHGPEIAKLLTRGKHHGVPFSAIFDSNEQLLIDSAGPLGNIGHPTDYEGKRHLRRMLTETRQRLTDADADIDELIDSLK